MLTRSELYKTSEYWIERIQNDLYRALRSYKEENNLNDSALADKLGFSKGYISQIMNGNFNFSISKLVELALSIGVSPSIHLENLEDYIIREERRLNQLQSHGFAKIENLKPRSVIRINAAENQSQEDPSKTAA